MCVKGTIQTSKMTEKETETKDTMQTSKLTEKEIKDGKKIIEKFEPLKELFRSTELQSIYKQIYDDVKIRSCANIIIKRPSGNYISISYAKSYGNRSVLARYHKNESEYEKENNVFLLDYMPSSKITHVWIVHASYCLQLIACVYTDGCLMYIQSYKQTESIRFEFSHSLDQFSCASRFEYLNREHITEYLKNTENVEYDNDDITFCGDFSDGILKNVYISRDNENRDLILPAGEIIVWTVGKVYFNINDYKKVYIELLVPKDAKRKNIDSDGNCSIDYAKVISITDVHNNHHHSASSYLFNTTTQFYVNHIVTSTEKRQILVRPYKNMYDDLVL